MRTGRLSAIAGLGPIQGLSHRHIMDINPQNRHCPVSRIDRLQVSLPSHIEISDFRID